MKIKPLNDRVLIKRDTVENISPGGIHLPTESQEKPVLGTVISVGPGVRNEAGAWKPTTVKPDDRVMFGKYSGFDTTIEGQEFVVMRETDIIGVIA